MKKKGKGSEGKGQMPEFAHIPGTGQATERELEQAQAYAESWRGRALAAGKKPDREKFLEVKRNFLVGKLRRRGVAVGAIEQEIRKEEAGRRDKRDKRDKPVSGDTVSRMEFETLGSLAAVAEVANGNLMLEVNGLRGELAQSARNLSDLETQMKLDREEYEDVLEKAAALNRLRNELEQRLAQEEFRARAAEERLGRMKSAYVLALRAALLAAE